MTYQMPLRLSDEQGANLRAVAQVEGVSMAQLARNSIDEMIARRRNDKRFQARLRKLIDENREALERLA